MIRLIYNLLWPIGLLFFLPAYLVKMFRRGGYREKFGQRLGLYETDVRERLIKKRSTWLHAVRIWLQPQTQSNLPPMRFARSVSCADRGGRLNSTAPARNRTPRKILRARLCL